MVVLMDGHLQDILWLESLAAGRAKAQEIGRLILLHPCGQGIGDTGDL